MDSCPMLSDLGNGSFRRLQNKAVANISPDSRWPLLNCIWPKNGVIWLFALFRYGEVEKCWIWAIVASPEKQDAKLCICKPKDIWAEVLQDRLQADTSKRGPKHMEKLLIICEGAVQKL